MELNLIILHIVVGDTAQSLAPVSYMSKSAKSMSIQSGIASNDFLFSENIFIFQLVSVSDATMLWTLKASNDPKSHMQWQSDWIINLLELKRTRKNQPNQQQQCKCHISVLVECYWKNQFHFNFMQIILTKSNKMKLLKQIGHLRLLIAWCVCSRFLVTSPPKITNTHSFSLSVPALHTYIKLLYIFEADAVVPFHTPTRNMFKMMVFHLLFTHSIGHRFFFAHHFRSLNSHSR